MPDFIYYLLKYSHLVLTVYFYIMIATIILSWTPIRNTKFYQILDMVSSPYLRIFRGWIVIGSMDLTPLVGLLLFQGLLALISRVI